VGRIKLKKILLIFFVLISTNAFSAEDYKSNFTIEKFEEAKKNGETVVVTAWNKYCGTCKRQKVVLDQAEKDFKDVLFLYYNHPKMKDIAKYLKIDHRSTILVYKGNTEISRTLGQIDKSVIYSNINKAI
jgi:thiol-disulfide isomerase/thioredoxin